MNDTKYGFIDKTGKQVIDLVYEGGGTFSQGIVSVKRNGLWGYIELVVS